MLIRRHSFVPFLAAANTQFTTVNPFQQIYEHKQSLTEQDRDTSLDSFQTDDQSSKGLFRERLVFHIDLLSLRRAFHR